MRTAAQVAVPQIALRDCSKEQEERQYACDFGEGGYMQSSTHFLQKVSASVTKLLRGTRNSHHHEGF